MLHSYPPLHIPEEEEQHTAAGVLASNTEGQEKRKDYMRAAIAAAGTVQETVRVDMVQGRAGAGTERVLVAVDMTVAAAGHHCRRFVARGIRLVEEQLDIAEVVPAGPHSSGGRPVFRHR